MEHFYTNNYQVLDPNWQNNPPQQFYSPNPYNKLPFYPSPYDPRFKNTIATEEITNNHEIIDQKTDDELWIETYLSKIGKININLNSNVEILTQKPGKSLTTANSSNNNNKKSLKIHVARSVLHRCLKLLEQLENLERYLRENVANISTFEWKQKTIEIGQQKDEFSALLSQFDDSSVLEQLHKAVRKRKHKRSLIRQRKINRNNRKRVESNKKKQLINKNIDQWLEKMKEDVDKVKHEETLKRDADCVLSEVTKKKSEARKQLQLLTALTKLRSVREKTAIANGERINLEDSNAFERNMEKLRKMWEEALERYMKEEHGLKVMLQNNTVMEIPRISTEKRIVMDWESVLFGPKIIPSDAYWGLMCAEKDIGTFIAIRFVSFCYSFRNDL